MPEQKWYWSLLANIRAWAYKYIGGLFMVEKDGKPTVSLGRVAMVIMLIMFLWVWRRAVIDGEKGVELPSGMLEVFYVLSGYVFGSKITSSLSTKWSNGKKTTLKVPKVPQQ